MLNILKWTSPQAGIGVGRDSRDAVSDAHSPAAHGVDREHQSDGKLIVQRRHIDFLEHQIRWRWLLDSYEGGGSRYRNAVYGPDRRGLPCRNLFRHRREYPDPQQFPTVYGGFAGGLANFNGQNLAWDMDPIRACWEQIQQRPPKTTTMS